MYPINRRRLREIVSVLKQQLWISVVKIKALFIACLRINKGSDHFATFQSFRLRTINHYQNSREFVSQSSVEKLFKGITLKNKLHRKDVSLLIAF